jgi:uncharacterized membrane protein YhaH (DUF805 family)
MNRISAVVFVLTLLPLQAHAYVDPGTGMLLIQGLIALIGGVIVFVRNPVATVKRWMERRKNPK